MGFGRILTDYTRILADLDGFSRILADFDGFSRISTDFRRISTGFGRVMAGSMGRIGSGRFFLGPDLARIFSKTLGRNPSSAPDFFLDGSARI